ncbi:hypothetical protein [Staphylospora marina]|uniref:hypothetical protein n=1 Tax=Staphylospora marina TaxID=2490858 RepID=UPI000F5BE18D|nr:hypothetical protein [Staphylospora marina]
MTRIGEAERMFRREATWSVPMRSDETRLQRKREVLPDPGHPGWLAQGILMREILGPPRALKPWRPFRTDRW